jgi:hypothetical protein
MPVTCSCGEYHHATGGSEDMSTAIKAVPPVRVTLYDHQIKAFLFVLNVFDAMEEVDTHDRRIGGDANERFHG